MAFQPMRTEALPDEPVIVTVRGVPAFQLAPVEDDDDLVDRLIETNAEFRQLLEKRRNDRFMPLKEALERMDEE